MRTDVAQYPGRVLCSSGGLLFKPASWMDPFELLWEAWYVLPRLRAAIYRLGEEPAPRPSYEKARMQ